MTERSQREMIEDVRQIAELDREMLDSATSLLLAMQETFGPKPRFEDSFTPSHQIAMRLLQVSGTAPELRTTKRKPKPPCK